MSRVELLANNPNPHIRQKAWEKWRSSGAIGTVRDKTISFLFDKNWLNIVRKIDPVIDKLIKDGFGLLIDPLNYDSERILRLVDKFVGLENVHFSKAYDSDGKQIPNLRWRWVPPVGIKIDT